MLDVIHFMFEEDSRYSTGEEAEAVSNLRKSIYATMYNTNYVYAYASNSANNGGRRYVSDSSPTAIDDFAMPKETKPYVPPTEFNPNSSMPFGSVLDAPLG